VEEQNLITTDIVKTQPYSKVRQDDTFKFQETTNVQVFIHTCRVCMCWLST